MAPSSAIRTDVDASVHGLAGAVAAQVCTLALYPLDQVRFLLQVEGQPGARAGQNEVPWWHLGATMSSLCSIARRHGLQALYRGVGPMLLTVSVSQGVYFWAYEVASSVLPVLPLPAVLRQLARSLVAAVITVLLTNPLWVATMRLKLLPGKDKCSSAPRADKATESLRAEGWLSFLLVFRLMAKIQEVEGTAALWRGLGSSLWLTCVPVMQFCTYEGLRSSALMGKERSHPSGVEAFIMGAAAKGLAVLSTYPLQVVQSNLRLAGQGGSTLPALAQLYRDRGVAGLYAGFEAKVLQTLMNGALMMLMYEKLVEVVASIRK